MRTSRDRRDDGRPEQARPRDRAGRPLAYGTTGVTTVEPSDPATVEEALALGIERWDEQRYFEAHELLEHAWKHAEGIDRELWKGVIQVAVAGVHLQRGNPTGAARLLERSLARLAGLPDVARGIDLAGLRTTAVDAMVALGRGEMPSPDWGAFPGCPDDVAAGPWFARHAGATTPDPEPTPIAS